MFYVNNKQVLGIFLNGNNFNYLAYGFGKIIPEDRNAPFAYINLAQRNLNQYRVEYGNIQSGYNNFPITRLDYPVNGIFHSPLTYYYGGSIVPTKNVPVLITNGEYALRNALVYSDMNINGAINHFASNTDFQGHNVNVFPEKDSSALLCYEMLNNCGNCNINTYNVISDFDHIYSSNFNIKLPSNANFEKSVYYSILSNSYNCNVRFDGTHSSLCSFRNGNAYLFLFQDLNNCNLNLLLGGSTGLEYAFGNRLNNCNIHFENMSLKGQCFGFMNNCTLTGNFKYADAWVAFAYSSRNVKLNINARNTNEMILLWNVDNVTGNANLSNDTNIKECSNSTLNLYDGNVTFNVVENCKFRLDKVNNVVINKAYNSNFNMRSSAGTATLINVHNCRIYANTVNGLIENVYNTSVELKNNNPNFITWKVNNCEITGFPTSMAYTTDCTFNTSISVALSRNSRYTTWANVWPHATPRGNEGFNTWYGTNAGLESTEDWLRCYLSANNASQVNDSISFDNHKNMIMSLLTFYSGTVTANLPNYTFNIKLNVDCNTLNLGIFQSGPPHGLEYSSISADNIYAKGDMPGAYVYMNYGTRIYCENFCNVAFSPVWRRFSDNYQPVMLINHYQIYNADALNLKGGITRIGRLTFQGGAPADMSLANGTCMFINNVTLNKVEVNNALLFTGSNVTIMQTPNVYNGGLIVSRSNYSMDTISKFVNRKNFTWNFYDYGPWGPRSLLNYCIDV